MDHGSLKLRMIAAISSLTANNFLFELFTKMSTSSNSISIPFFGARKLARQLSAELDELKARLSAEEAKTQKLSEIARSRVSDAKAIQAERDQACTLR